MKKLRKMHKNQNVSYMPYYFAIKLVFPRFSLEDNFIFYDERHIDMIFNITIIIVNKTFGSNMINMTNKQFTK